MKRPSSVPLLAFALLNFALTAASQENNQDPLTDWIDPATGHRVIRLSPDDGGSSLYFHQNTYTPEGDKIIFDSKGTIVAVDLKSLGDKPPKPTVVVQGASAIA